MEAKEKTMNEDLAALVNSFKATHATVKETKPKTIHAWELFKEANSERQEAIVRACIENFFNDEKPRTVFDFYFLAVAKPKNNKQNTEFWTKEICLENIKLVTALAVNSIQEKGKNSSFNSKWLEPYGKAIVGSFQKDNAL